MKNLLLLLSLILIGLSSCDGKKEPKFKIDPRAKVLIRPASGVQTRSENPKHLTAKEIVEQAVDISFINEPLFGKQGAARGFSDKQKDVEKLLLMMWANDIIDERTGEYVPEFIESKDCVLRRELRISNKFYLDTIGYIPNSVMQAGQIKIKAAYDRGDYEEVYRLFNKTYTFTPITAEEWRTLKAEGKE